jgi:hypothetical protein
MTICTEGGRNLFELGFEGNDSYGILKIWYFVCFLICLATLSESCVLYRVEVQNHYKQYFGMMWRNATCSIWSYSPGMCLEIHHTQPPKWDLNPEPYKSEVPTTLLWRS